MARVLERSILEKKLAEVKMELLEPEYLLIHEHHNIVCKNRFGNIVTFSFAEIWAWLHDLDNYVGCHANCEMCLTPIC